MLILSTICKNIYLSIGITPFYIIYIKEKVIVTQKNDFFMLSIYITSFKLTYNIKYYEKTFSIIYIIMKNKIYLNKFIDENKRSYES